MEFYLCEVQLPSVDLVEMSTLFLIHVDQELIVEVPGKEIAFQDYCTEHTTFTVQMSDPLIPIENSIFSVSTVQGVEVSYVSLTVSTEDRT